MSKTVTLVAAAFVIMFGMSSFYGLWKTSEVIQAYTLTDRISSEWIAWTMKQYAFLLLSSVSLKFCLNFWK